MDTRARLAAAAGGAALLFLLVQLGALVLVDPFVEAGYQAVEDPTDPTNSLVYLLAILVMTGFILAVIKLEIEVVLRATVILMSTLLAWYVTSVAVPLVVPGVGPVIPAALAVLVGVALLVHPEWYVIDVAGVLIGAGGAGLFGISFGPLPAIILLGALAVYDAVAVYGTEHMLTLADSVVDQKLPLFLIIPLTVGYSFLEDDVMTGDEAEDGQERNVYIIGLGDAVMPSILVASAAVFVDAPVLLGSGFPLNLPALMAIIGTQTGLILLMWQVSKGNPHAGLPLLNGGSIAGFLLGSLAAGVPLVEAVGLAPYL